MAITKNKGAIVQRGGGTMYYKQVNDDGTDLTIPDTWHILPYIQSSNITITSDTNEIKDETGDIIASEDVNYSVKLSGIFMQVDKDTLDFLGKTCRGKYYRIYINRGIVDGKTQEVMFGIGRFKAGFVDETGTRKPPFEVSFLKNDNIITESLNLPSGAVATSFSIPAGEYYVISET